MLMYIPLYVCCAIQVHDGIHSLHIAMVAGIQEKSIIETLPSSEELSVLGRQYLKHTVG